jgi:hypothetical protein
MLSTEALPRNQQLIPKMYKEACPPGYLCDFRQNTVGIYKISMVRAPDGEQFAQETHRLVLKTLGKFSRLRANSAHSVGHLPTESYMKQYLYLMEGI